MTMQERIVAAHAELGSVKAVQRSMHVSYVTVTRALKVAGVDLTGPRGTSTQKCPNCLHVRHIVPGRPTRHTECLSCRRIDTGPIDADPPAIQWVRDPKRWGVMVGVVLYDPHEDAA